MDLKAFALLPDSEFKPSMLSAISSGASISALPIMLAIGQIPVLELGERFFDNATFLNASSYFVSLPISRALI